MGPVSLTLPIPVFRVALLLPATADTRDDEVTTTATDEKAGRGRDCVGAAAINCGRNANLTRNRSARTRKPNTRYEPMGIPAASCRWSSTDTREQPTDNEPAATPW